MADYIVIAANGPWYELFYNLAFIAALIILLFEGYRRKFPMLKWIILIAITRMFFIAGTKIVTIPFPDFINSLSQFRLPEAPDKSLAGGFLFGAAALAGGSFLLRFRQNITDAFALVLPLGLAIQRLGCFFTGCCFGKVSSLPWAVQYPAQTLPHYHQFNNHLLTYSDFLSLPVHPVQIYETAGMLAAFFLVLYFRKRLKRSGNLFLFSLVLIFSIRFAVEFFRDINAHTIGGKMVGILNTTQLALLPLIFLLIIVIRKREHKPAETFVADDFRISAAFFLLLLLTVVFRGLKSWFVFPEVVALTITFLVAFSILGYRILMQFRLVPHRLVYAAGFVLPFLLMAQTFPYGQDSVVVKKYKTLKFGMATGDFENSHTIGHGTGCDRVNNTEYFRQEYTLAGVALEITEEIPATKTIKSYGLKTVVGHHLETRISDGYDKSTVLADFNPYGVFEKNWLGIGAGLHLGSLAYITENLNADGYDMPESGSNRTVIYPQFYARVGPRRWFFIDYHFADHFPSALPGFRHQFGFGTGLGLRNGTQLRYGGNTQNMWYVSGYFPIQKNWAIEPMLLWSISPTDYTDKSFYQYSFGVSYNFDFSQYQKRK